MTDTHTAGPWEACDPGDYSDFDGQSVVILGDDRRVAVVQGDSEESVANARLIAAAPAMLEALRGIEAAYSIVCIVANSDPEKSQSIVRARAAIALATGEAK